MDGPSRQLVFCRPVRVGEQARGGVVTIIGISVAVLVGVGVFVSVFVGVWVGVFVGLGVLVGIAVSVVVGVEGGKYDALTYRTN